MRRLAAALTLAAAVLPAAPALAGGTQESQVQDDPRLVYGSPQEVEAALEGIRRIGADRVRVTLQWRLVAPRPESRRRPAFDASDPEAYGAKAWERYDRIVLLARRKGLGVNFNVTAPGPRWAMRSVRRRDIRHVYAPSPTEFGRFVRAAGRRYGPHGPGGGLLAVDFWSIWNEPNQGAWLAPQWAPARGTRRLVEWAPQRYRRLVDVSWRALHETGHADDTILVGELAPTGRADRGRTRPIKPRAFLRALYCVDRRLRPLRGSAAAQRACPRTASERRRFVARHPGLFRATGFAHHPYSLLTSPRRRTRDRDSVAMADLGRLRSDLVRIFRRWGAGRRGLPLYLTEYGFQTNPPDRWAGISTARQAAWLNEADHMAWRRSYVRQVSQFLLFDDAPDRRHSRGSSQYWRTFQSGLLTHTGRPKPSLFAYQVPIVVTQRVKPRNRPFRIWGQVRPAGPGPVRVDVEWRPRAGSWRLWKRVTTVTTRNARGYLQALTRLPAGAGQVRLVWEDPATGVALGSRAVNVRAR